MPAMAAFNRKDSGVKGGQPEKKLHQGRSTEELAALAAFIQKNSDINGVCPLKQWNYRRLIG